MHLPTQAGVDAEARPVKNTMRLEYETDLQMAPPVFPPLIPGAISDFKLLAIPRHSNFRAPPLATHLLWGKC